MRYLSQEWKNEQWRDFEETQIAGDDSDCGGWRWDPPCGGCARCMRDQFSYYMGKEEEQARVWLAVGLEVAPIGLVRLDYFPGFGGCHDSHNCWMSGEREVGLFPWEKVPR